MPVATSAIQLASLLFVAGLGITIPSAFDPMVDPDCPLSMCDVSTDGGDVVVDGSIRTPAQYPTNPNTPGADWDPGWEPSEPYDPNNPGTKPIPPCTEDISNPNLPCGWEEEAEPAPGDEPVVVYPAVSASDLVSFTPSKPVFTVEPDGAGLVGKPVNFVADAETHTLSGTLLGFSVSVQFIPISYTFDYGDGTSQSTTSGGTSWVDSGSAQFTPTDTSHTYTERGTYTTQSTVEYAAWVDFGDGIWRSVDGTVTAVGPSVDIRIYRPKTALVDKTCLEDPTGTGCP